MLPSVLPAQDAAPVLVQDFLAQGVRQFTVLTTYASVEQVIIPAHALRRGIVDALRHLVDTGVSGYCNRVRRG